MDDLLSEFLTETSESIDVVDVEVVKLEQEPNNKAVLDNIFRLVHTIKGTCGFLGLPRLEAVAHSAENVLGKFRDGELEVTPEAVTLILRSLDRIKEILSGLEATGQEPQGDDSELIARLDATAAGEAPDGGDETVVEDEAAEQEQPASIEADDVAAADLGRPLKPGEVPLDELEAVFQATPGPEDLEDGADGGSADLFARLGGDDSLVVAANAIFNKARNDRLLGEAFSHPKINLAKKSLQEFLAALWSDEAAPAKAAAQRLFEDRVLDETGFKRFVEIVNAAYEEIGTDVDDRSEAVMLLEEQQGWMVASADVIEAAQAQAANEEAKGDGQKSESVRTTQSIRVNVDLLEDLMNLVSELVLTRNQLLQMVRRMEDSEFAVPLQRLSQCTTELQEGVMKTRMQPIGNAWAKLPRIVRDLSIELDKKIDLEMKGADTELDRQVLELIKDPLTHMVRNSADHGIETPEIRRAAGKAEIGKVRLNAYHEGGHIIIEVSDDGRGIDSERLKNKLIENQLVSEAELDKMAETQIQKFIFHPGLSTAEEVTSVSGRGVGMDVVRSNIEKIGGTIDLVSAHNEGTTFYIKIPLTLAIVSALVVQAGEERFAIPQISVLELVRAADDSEHRIEHINETPVLRLRNRLLPLVYLRDILKFGRETDTSDSFIVVTQVGTFSFGIVVDAVFDTEEIVVKPVAPLLKDIAIYSGNTILGDGSVIMILDPNGIANMVSTASPDVDGQDEVGLMGARVENLNRESMLLFRAGTDSPKAVPLSLIARLEEIECDQIERSDGQPMVQYRGRLMPLVTIDPSCQLNTEGRQSVLVFTDGDHTMGLAVEEILDIVDEQLDIELNSETRGMIGTAVVVGKVTEIIDVAYYLQQAFGDWLVAKSDDVLLTRRAGKAAVLLVDDSAFFRNMLKPLLSAAGYDVTAVESADAALKLREKGKEFDLILSDIEMPGLSGYELAEEIKAGGAWQDTPLVALSGLASRRDFERGRQVGFNDYVAKLDRDALLKALAQQISIKANAA